LVFDWLWWKRWVVCAVFGRPTIPHFYGRK
jgi:hypothetical protein